MALTTDQKTFFQEYGYLPYTRVVSDEELEALRQRSEDIAEGRVTHVPSRYIQLEAAFSEGEGYRHTPHRHRSQDDTTLLF